MIISYRAYDLVHHFRIGTSQLSRDVDIPEMLQNVPLYISMTVDHESLVLPNNSTTLQASFALALGLARQQSPHSTCLLFYEPLHAYKRVLTLVQPLFSPQVKYWKQILYQFLCSRVQGFTQSHVFSLLKERLGLF